MAVQGVDLGEIIRDKKGNPKEEGGQGFGLVPSFWLGAVIRMQDGPQPDLC